MALAELTSGETVTIQRLRAAAGDGFAAEETWETVAVRRCGVQPARPLERDAFGRAGYEASHVFYFDADPQVDARHRFLWRGRRFERLRPRDLAGRGRAWAVAAVEIEPDGRIVE